MKDDYTTNSHYLTYTFLLEGWENVPFELGSERVKGPFTHAIFDAISDAISRTKRALPYPARMFFSRSIAWIGKKGMTYYSNTPFFLIPANLTVFRRTVTRLKTRAG